ncbi:hypothetical protein [Streptomyces sp. H27-C3]|uniref:GNAT family N-acetyltransferase n=1 Tax=Streptomyces sp. H27-C3 TaxID=3046305 RepID=UPI0032D959D3
MTGAPRVRHARAADLARVAELAAEHATYEKAGPPASDLAARLNGLLFGDGTPRLHRLVAELPDGELVGYATCAPEVSTWEGTDTCTWTAPSCAPPTAAWASAGS